MYTPNLSSRFVKFAKGSFKRHHVGPMPPRAVLVTCSTPSQCQKATRILVFGCGGCCSPIRGIIKRMFKGSCCHNNWCRQSKETLDKVATTAILGLALHTNYGFFLWRPFFTLGRRNPISFRRVKWWSLCTFQLFEEDLDIVCKLHNALAFCNTQWVIMLNRLAILIPNTLIIWWSYLEKKSCVSMVVLSFHSVLW